MFKGSFTEVVNIEGTDVVILTKFHCPDREAAEKFVHDSLLDTLLQVSAADLGISNWEVTSSGYVLEVN